MQQCRKAMCIKNTRMTPPHSPNPKAPSYAVSDAQEAWERFDQLARTGLEAPEEAALPVKGDVRKQIKKSGSQVSSE